MREGRFSVPELRRRVYGILEHGPIGDSASLIVSRSIVLLIVVNLVAVALELMPELGARYRPWFDAIELLSLVVFTVEYGLRLWVAVEHAAYRHQTAARARWHYATSAAGIVDLLAILPFWFAFILPEDLRVLLVLRIIRFLKVARYSPAMRSLLEALYRERRALLGCVVILIATTLIMATLMYLAERHVQPGKLGTIPDAMWWAIVTSAPSATATSCR